jgi:leucyl aminopeptidase
LARDEDWKLDFLDQATLRRKHAGAFLAVAQGSPQADAGILHLRYQPARRTRKPALALVGKGICFDTGGMNLKPARHMHGMHEDMAGSAVALGTLLALSRLKVDFPVDCWLALAQNHIGPNAYKQNDVVRAANGISIEVVHTDAEGRMVLADTLYLASRERPALLLNYATLTGSCIQALGTNYSGVFTTDERLRNAAIAAGRDSGERVWPFPMDGDYDALLESQIADIKQCTLDNEADHILAARFLTRFVDPAVRWLHVDLSAVNRKGGLAHVPTDTTGFGVRFTLELLLRRHALAAI